MIEVGAPPVDGSDRVLTGAALEFVAELHRSFEAQREAVLRHRGGRRERLAAGESLDFLPSTAWIRAGDWKVADAPADLRDRRVELTGPTERKMLINALNSGARCYMADFEDSNVPTWENIVGGQLNLIEAVEGGISYRSPDGRTYELKDDVATLIVRPRGWHLPETHLLIDGRPIAGALLDFGLYFFHNARLLLERGGGPYFYLPKLESHQEARLWNEVFNRAQELLEIPLGSIRTTVLVETVPAAFEMDEILYELREHAAGLNAGRWDYIFSMIKCFRERPEFVLPDRNDVRMTVPFMHAYTELLVKTCHRRGAHAIGGMSALVPDRRDPDAHARALEGVSQDKRREAEQGFDGTWVAHPDLVEVARAEFDRVLSERPNQLDRVRNDVEVSAEELLDVRSTPGAITWDGLRNDVRVGVVYLAAWLAGRGAVAIDHLMEDTATAEIARSQVWQWLRHGVALDDGTMLDRETVRRIVAEESARAIEERRRAGEDPATVAPAAELLESLILDQRLREFLTIPAAELALAEDIHAPRRAPPSPVAPGNGR